MLGWIASHWDTILTVGSLLLNALGVTGVIPPVKTPKGFERVLSKSDFDDRS